MVSSFCCINPQILLKEQLEETLNNEIKKARLNRTTLSLIIVDLSKTQREETLKTAAMTLRRKIRCTDIIGKTRAKEFVIIVPNMDKKRTTFLVNRLKKNVNSFEEGESNKINIGLSSFPEDGLSRKELIDKATYSLYKNKIW